MFLQDKRVVITGGTGSLGKILTKRVLSGEMGTPKKVIIFSRDEAKQHNMRLSYMHKKEATDEVIYENFSRLLDFRIGDIRRYEDVCNVLREADVVINTAALKQVPACEYFPYQAVLTNVMGAENIVQAIRQNNYPIDTVVCVSTDKAAKPINVMGMTKAVQERILLSANLFCPKTRFVGVRYGNVLASRGSVIPMFHDQLKKGLPLTLTSKDMTRFLLSINEAVDVIFAALNTAHAGEIVIPDVISATMYNIAKALIGDKKNEIKVIGIRPGEKIDEILVSEEECYRTVKRGNYYIIRPMLPEITAKSNKSNEKIVLEKELSSGDKVASLEETIALLKKHDLLDPEGSKASDKELLV